MGLKEIIVIGLQAFQLRNICQSFDYEKSWLTLVSFLIPNSLKNGNISKWRWSIGRKFQSIQFYKVNPKKTCYNKGTIEISES